MDEQSYKQMAAQLRQPHGEEGVKTGVSMNQGNRHINLNTIEILNPQKGDNILEIGMGNGMFVKNVIEKDLSIRYTGVDHSPLMIREAERINATWIKDGRASFVKADVASLPFPDKTFNKIFTINTIYFWDDPRKNFIKVRKVLTPNGKLIVAIRPRHQMESYPFTKYGFQMFTKAELHELLISNGFSVETIHEVHEPDYEFNGMPLKMESLVAEAVPMR
jgi:ubiquinone/menaquinone biosynthesis C-methylase UbiE